MHYRKRQIKFNNLIFLLFHARFRMTTHRYDVTLCVTRAVVPFSILLLFLRYFLWVKVKCKEENNLILFYYFELG
jgi:hypothetical protein